MRYATQSHQPDCKAEEHQHECNNYNAAVCRCTSCDGLERICNDTPLCAQAHIGSQPMLVCRQPYRLTRSLSNGAGLGEVCRLCLGRRALSRVGGADGLRSCHVRWGGCVGVHVRKCLLYSQAAVRVAAGRCGRVEQTFMCVFRCCRAAGSAGRCRLVQVDGMWN